MFKNKLIIFVIIFLTVGCFDAPAINESYNFDLASVINLDKIADHINRPGSGQIMEDNISLMFMKNGFNVSQLNNKGKRTLTLSCTLTDYTDRETILIPYRLEDKGTIETTITQSSASSGSEKNAIATTSTTTTTDGGSIQESGKIEYTQARVGVILKIKDEETGLLVWTHSYWYSGIELSSTTQICAKNSVGLISKLFNK